MRGHSVCFYAGMWKIISELLLQDQSAIAVTIALVSVSTSVFHFALKFCFICLCGVYDDTVRQLLIYAHRSGLTPKVLPYLDRVSVNPVKKG